MVHACTTNVARMTQYEQPVSHLHHAGTALPQGVMLHVSDDDDNDDDDDDDRK